MMNAVINELYVLSIGFSIVAGIVLLAAYLRSDLFPKKTAFAVTSGVLLTACLIILQWYHLLAFTADIEPLSQWTYRGALFLAPALFFFFGTAIVLPEAPLRPWLALHLTPCLLPLILPFHLALPLLLLIGAGYATWLGSLVYRIRQQRKQHRFEMLFSLVIIGSAAVVLVLGVSIPWISTDYFYAFYTHSIAAAYALVTFALVGIPDFVNDLFEVTHMKYASSTLGGVDVDAKSRALEGLMSERALYRDDTLSLGAVAEHLSLTSHQLSELINRHLGCSFSQYVRGHRVKAAQKLLREQPAQSVLSIGLETGFRSQSAFYSAFKEATGMSPGDYRKTNRGT